MPGYVILSNGKIFILGYYLPQFTLLFRHDVIPIVMGARPEDYAVSAPYKSYIHVDDFDGPKELADYLHKLDQDDQLYNEYFKWKVCILCI